MSVINKMLRDLDQRQVPGSGTPDPLRRATASVAALSPLPRRSYVGPGLLLLLLLAGVAGAWLWWSGSLLDAPVASAPHAKAVPAAPASVDVVAAPAASAASAVLPAPAPVVDVTPTMPPAVSAPPSPAVAVPVASPAVPAPAAPGGAQASVGLRMDAKLSTAVAARSEPVAPQAKVVPESVHPGGGPATPAKPAASAAEPALATRQQQAAREALAQSQAMWAGGAREAAISTLQEAVATAERSPGASSPATLVPLVRELVRMQLAEGQAAAAWELLARMEPLMNNQPELWALRANAAQRLGRHQDSVQAYTTALQSRPGEPRWLLGAAVSLAALGQTGAAAEMVDKARAAGPISREVLAYLRQQGVPLTEKP